MPTFSKDSWHARLWRYTYEEEWRSCTPPNNLCPYFWSVVFALMQVGVLWLPAQLWRLTEDGVKKGEWPLQGLMALCCFVLACMTGVRVIKVVLSDITVYWYAVSPLVGAAIWSIVALFGWWGFELGRLSKNKDPEDESLVVAKLKATKNKVCPQINWTDAD